MATAGGVPKLTVFYLLLAVGGTIYMFPDLRDITGSWSADFAALAPAARVEAYTQTTAVSLLQLTSAGHTSLSVAEPRVGLLLPAVALSGSSLSSKRCNNARASTLSRRSIPYPAHPERWYSENGLFGILPC